MPSKVCGSSPRMRGTYHFAFLFTTPSRFIPAHAGNIGGRARPADDLPVHPRACGEHVEVHSPPSIVSGSSPRMRGTYRLSAHLAFGLRFIPAHAGNISREWSIYPGAAVHPRACGEHHVAVGFGYPAAGSSPRMRGTWIDLRQGVRRVRFIPAHAGNMSFASRS